MAEYNFQRECRTPSSESYRIEDNEGTSVGRIDIHLTDSGTVYATLCVAERLTEEEIQELIGEADERLVMTADSYREDFIVTVWAGRQVGVYSDEDSEDEDEDFEGNGHRL